MMIMIKRAFSHGVHAYTEDVLHFLISIAIPVTSYILLYFPCITEKLDDQEFLVCYIVI